MSQIRALSDLLFAVVDGGAKRVEEMHLAVARKAFGAVEVAKVTRLPARGARFLHDGITAGVYALVRGANTVLGTTAGIALESLAAVSAEPRPSRRRDLAVGALNGAVGDWLARQGSDLQVKMEFHHGDRALPAERAALAAAFPRATGKLAIFVHGLMGNEHGWRFYAQEHYGNRHTTYGSRLAADLGYTPLYLRYNSGLHISENGRQLAHLLDAMAQAWPVEIEEIALIGHSMGGLVARSACHYGREAERAWVGRVRHVVCLGTPHHGAPLEKAANVAGWLLRRFDVTRPLGEINDGRSAGIKDLRFGSVVDEDWQGRDVDALLQDHRQDVALLESAEHYFVAAALTESPRHPLAAIVGDSLVRVPSARGQGKRARIEPDETKYFGGLSHMRLLNHPAVYEQLHRWLASAASSEL